ncbi:MAG TPA: hypothetical protein VHK06_08550 [Candidatus Limnocylindria bacterium]|nr:hypothetical protein [Candidatus Limnocylindria bacterium]
MLEPFWIIVALIAIATVLLFPVRLWYLSRYDRDGDREEPETPSPPSERRDSG